MCALVYELLLTAFPVVVNVSDASLHSSGKTTNEPCRFFAMEQFIPVTWYCHNYVQAGMDVSANADYACYIPNSFQYRTEFHARTGLTCDCTGRERTCRNGDKGNKVKREKASL